jgi:hypothetical protein
VCDKLYEKLQKCAKTGRKLSSFHGTITLALSDGAARQIRIQYPATSDAVVALDGMLPIAREQLRGVLTSVGATKVQLATRAVFRRVTAAGVQEESIPYFRTRQHALLRMDEIDGIVQDMFSQIMEEIDAFINLGT